MLYIEAAIVACRYTSCFVVKQIELIVDIAAQYSGDSTISGQ